MNYYKDEENIQVLCRIRRMNDCERCDVDHCKLSYELKTPQVISLGEDEESTYNFKFPLIMQDVSQQDAFKPV